MEQTIINAIITTIIANIAMYMGFINKMKSDIAVLISENNAFKEKIKKVEDQIKEETIKYDDISHKMAVIENSMKRIESRQDSHSKKYDELLTLINEIKLEMVKQFGKLASEMTSFSAMVEASDSGVKVNKHKK